jgi:hypothetical protein
MCVGSEAVHIAKEDRCTGHDVVEWDSKRERRKECRVSGRAEPPVKTRAFAGWSQRSTKTRRALEMPKIVNRGEPPIREQLNADGVADKGFDKQE